VVAVSTEDELVVVLLVLLEVDVGVGSEEGVWLEVGLVVIVSDETLGVFE
jgi:hypothetical protein